MKTRDSIEEEDGMGEERFRLVVLGSNKVGKTSIIRRYLYREFSGKYKETVEDLHSRQFRIRGVPLPLDILDTNFNFPDMRRLAISSASAFMLVFSVDDVQSFKEMSDLWKEVCDRRADIASIPVVVVGNKCDLPKKIYEATATAWTSRLCADVRYVECSAKDDIHITDIFRTLLELSGFPKCKAGGGALDENEEENGVATPQRQGSLRGRPLSRQEKGRKEALTQTASLGVPCGDLKRNRSLRMKSPRREGIAENGPEEPSKLTRSKSLIKRTKHLSLKMRRHGEKVNDEVQDESDCVIS